MGSKILATGHYLPEKIITNDDLANILDTSHEWIIKRTGIASRHIATVENTSDLAVRAASSALAQAGISAEKVDFIIVATMTPDASSPSTASLVQKGIGAVNAFCFDLNAACSGFVFALSTACHLLHSANYQYGLVIGAETMSKVIDWKDRSTAVLFGDGAGAVLLGQADEQCVIAEDLHSDGNGASSLEAQMQPIANFLQPKAATDCYYLRMDGRAIFDFAVRRIPASLHHVLDLAGSDPEEVSAVLAHQANIRLLESISKKAKISLEKFASNIEKTGNTSAASIPILLDQMIQAGNLHLGSKEKILLTGFGGGLTWGSMLITL